LVNLPNPAILYRGGTTNQSRSSRWSIVSKDAIGISNCKMNHIDIKWYLTSACTKQEYPGYKQNTREILNMSESEFELTTASLRQKSRLCKHIPVKFVMALELDLCKVLVAFYCAKYYILIIIQDGDIETPSLLRCEQTRSSGTF